MLSSTVTLDSIPSEILLEILDVFPARKLLALGGVNRRFLSAVTRILKHRLIQASSLPEHQLALESFHPSVKNSTPYLFCEHLRTDYLEGNTLADAKSYHGEYDLSELRGIYSHFRPVTRASDGSYPPSRCRSTSPPGQGVDQLRTQKSNTVQLEEESELASQNLFFNAGEQDSHLCTVTNLVKQDVDDDLFLSNVNISEGVARVKRDWLEEESVRTVLDRGRRDASLEEHNKRIIWVDPRTRNVGLRFRVIKRESVHDTAVDIDDDEDGPVSYRLEYEELLIRSNQLLLMTEESREEELPLTEGIPYPYRRFTGRIYTAET